MNWKPELNDICLNFLSENPVYSYSWIILILSAGNNTFSAGNNTFYFTGKSPFFEFIPLHAAQIQKKEDCFFDEFDNIKHPSSSI